MCVCVTADFLLHLCYQNSQLLSVIERRLCLVFWQLGVILEQILPSLSSGKLTTVLANIGAAVDGLRELS